MTKMNYTLNQDEFLQALGNYLVAKHNIAESHLNNMKVRVDEDKTVHVSFELSDEGAEQ